MPHSITHLDLTRLEEGDCAREIVGSKLKDERCASDMQKKRDGAMKRQITIIVPEWSSGGVERVVLNLLARLDRERFEPSLLIFRSYETALDLPTDVAVIDLSARRVKYALPAVARHLHRHPPDVVLSHMSVGNSWALISRALARQRYPIVCVEHSTLSVEYEHGSCAQRLIPWLIRRTHRWADAIVSVSRASAEDLERLLAPNPPPIEVIYNPVVSDHIDQLARGRAAHPWFDEPDLHVILSVGRLANSKNFSRLIRAFAGVAREDPSTRLVILGEGLLRTDLEAEIARAGLEDVVAMPGFVENPYPSLSRAAVFALSSVYEGLPTVLIEAMACGTPIVATDSAGGVREILEDGRFGTIVPQDDDALTAGLLRAIRDGNQRAEDLRRRAADFSVETAVEAYERLLDSVIARASGGGRKDEL